VPEVAIDDDGDAVVAWQRSDGINDRVQARFRSAAGVLDRVTNVSRPGHHGRNPRVALDAAGDGLVVWERVAGAVRRIQGRDVSAAGVFGGLQTISEDLSFGPTVAIAAGGHTVVVWRRTNGTNDRIQARERLAGGAFEPILNLTPTTGEREAASNPEIAINADGRAVVIWIQAITTSSGTFDAVWAAHRLPGRWFSRETLDGAPSTGPQVAIDADGTALGVWQYGDSDSQIRAAVSP
jgi:hypothetical protein